MYEHFNVPMKSLEKSHKLPPEQIFQNAQGVVISHLGVRVESKNQFRKIFNRKSLKSLRVYLVINNGYIFVYTRNGWGYALYLKEKQDYGYKKCPEDGSQFHAQITLCFKYRDLKLEFDEAKVYYQWWNLLNAFFNPRIDREDLQYFAREFAPDAFSESSKFVVTAERMDEKDKAQRVRVLRYPANIVNLDETFFQETYLKSPSHSEWFGASFATPRQDQKETADDEEEEAYPLTPRTVQRRKWSDHQVEEERPPPPLLPQILSLVTPPYEEEQPKTPSPPRRLLADEIFRANIAKICSQQASPYDTETFEDEEKQQPAPLISYSAPTPHSNAPRSSDSSKNKKKTNYKD